MQFIHNGVTIHHTIKPRLKHSYISIDEYGEVHLKTPKVSKEFVFELLEKKAVWIAKHSQKNKHQKPLFAKEIEFFGAIENIENIPELRNILNNIKVKTPQNYQRHIDLFYKNLAKEYIPKRVEYFAKKMGLQYSRIGFRKMKRRWGSCSKDRVLTFNTNLIKRPKAFIDEVVVHELAHIVHFNHSKKFYKLMERYLEK